MERYSEMQSLQQIIDERISFLKEQINPQNKPEENRTFQLQIEAIRSAAVQMILKKLKQSLQKRKHC
jgi:phosphoserine aminotransferase